MRFVVFAVILLVLTACATPHTRVLRVTESHPPTAQVELLLDPPKRPYRTFALLVDNDGGPPEEVNARLTQAGRELGADAVLITDVSDETRTEWVPVGSTYFRNYW